MFYNLLSMRAIQVGIVFFVLVVGGSLLYSWHIHYTTNAELAETQHLLKHSEDQNAARPASIDFTPPGASITTPEATDPQRSAATAAAIDDSDSDDIEMLLFDEFFAEALPVDVASLTNEVNEKGQVSPNGFGPLPAVPGDYPNQNVWSEERLTRITPEHELLSRVRIEL